MKTAVEFLFEEMNKIRLDSECDMLDAMTFFRRQNKSFEEAKRLENKQNRLWKIKFTD